MMSSDEKKAAYMRKRRLEKGDELREYERKWKKGYYQRNKEKLRRMCRENYHKNRKVRLEVSKIYRDHLKMIALQIYGGYPPKCECCGEGHVAFLTLDHKDNNGKQHREEMRSKIYTWLKRHNYPKNLNLRVLCMNCNWAIALFGSCPHG